MSMTPEEMVVAELHLYAANNDIPSMAAHVAHHKIDLNASVKPSVVNALHRAAQANAAAAIRWLVENGADVNARQTGSWTPLHTATSCGAVDAFITLLDLGADPEIQSDTKETPFTLLNNLTMDLRKSLRMLEALDALKARNRLRQIAAAHR